MTDPRPDDADVPCTEIVELASEYLEGSLDPELMARIDAHLGVCPGCVTILDQWRQVIRAVGSLREEDVEPVAADLREALLDAFRRAQDPPG